MEAKEKSRPATSPDDPSSALRPRTAPEDDPPLYWTVVRALGCLVAVVSPA